jgi:hypothetical protein
MRGGNGLNFARQRIMREVLRTGLNGWHGETRENFCVNRGMAEHRRRTLRAKGEAS